MNHRSLKARQRRERATHSPSAALRIHRALSWLGRAEQLEGDRDTQFILLWIAFNAAYAGERDERRPASERSTYKEFLDTLLAMDGDGVVEDLVWTEFPGSIRLLLDNAFIFPGYWRGAAAPAEGWQAAFATANRAATRALGARDTSTVLSIVLSRLYVLRNQLVHGGATWNGKVNRAQVRDGANLLRKFVPAVIGILLDHADHDWGPASYPVVE
jgi:hypothetical protein